MKRSPLAAALSALLLAACSAAPAQSADPLLSPTDFAWINRLTWGAGPADIADYHRLGRDAWIKAQLTSPPEQIRLPESVQPLFDSLSDDPDQLMKTVVYRDNRRLAASKMRRTNMDQARAEAGQVGAIGRDYHLRARARSMLRDIYSRDQLREQMSWFWFNHFNIRFAAGPFAPLGTHYLERTIRPRALGRFCDLVTATQRHPAMLLYLNNAQSRTGKINENYARELLELHTMGVGSGYSQADVQEMARVLTGLTVDLNNWPAPAAPRGGWRDGLALFDPALHDSGSKTLLGTRITARGMDGIDQATTLACRHPATARRIAQRIAVYMMADDPPAAVVDALAAEFARSDGDIAAMLALLFARPEFVASLGTLYKDPNHYVISAARLAYADQLIRNPGLLAASIDRMGQGRMVRVTPDGWPLESANWNASGQLEMRFELATQLARGMPRLFLPPEQANMPAAALLSGNPPLKATLARTGLYPVLAPATQAALDAAADTREWNALFLSSPEFMRR